MEFLEPTGEGPGGDEVEDEHPYSLGLFLSEVHGSLTRTKLRVTTDRPTTTDPLGV